MTKLKEYIVKSALENDFNYYRIKDNEDLFNYAFSFPHNKKLFELCPEFFKKEINNKVIKNFRPVNIECSLYYPLTLVNKEGEQVNILKGFIDAYKKDLVIYTNHNFTF
jgi:hypothetical protein